MLVLEPSNLFKFASLVMYDLLGQQVVDSAFVLPQQVLVPAVHPIVQRLVVSQEV